MDIAGGRRRQIIVDKPYQVRAAVIGALYVVAVSVCLALPLVFMMRTTRALLDGHSPEMLQLFERQSTDSLIAFAVTCAGITIISVLFSLWRSHKIAGPVIKITRFVHDIAAGDYSYRIQLRSGDELQALARALNNMVDSLEERQRATKENVLRQIRDAKQELRASPSDDGLAAMDRLFAGLAERFGSRTDDETGDPQLEEVVQR